MKQRYFINSDGFGDLIIGAPGFNSGDGDLGAVSVFYGGARSVDVRDNARVLSNMTVSGSGEFLVGDGGRPVEFRDLSVSDNDNVFRFTLLGDGAVGDVVRLTTNNATVNVPFESGFVSREETVAAKLFDEAGRLVADSGTQFDLRNVVAGTYFLRLSGVDGLGILPDTKVNIFATVPLRGLARSSSDHDVLRGGDGDDTLSGNAQLDKLFGDSGLDAFVGSSLESFDLKVDERRSDPVSDDRLDNDVVSATESISFADDNLKNAILRLLEDRIQKSTAFDLPNITEVYPDDLKNLLELNLRNQSVSDLTGLEHATNLRALNLAGNQLTTLKPAEDKGVAGLTRLEFLAVDNNQLTTLDGIQNSTFLNRLSLTSNSSLTTEGLTPLTELQFINHLNVTSSDVSGLDPVLGHVTQFGNTVTTEDGTQVELTRGTLVIHAGAFAFRRIREENIDDESFTLEQTAFDAEDGTASVTLSATINGMNFSQSFENVSSVLLDAGPGSDTLSITGDVTIPIRTFNTTMPTTGSGADNIVITGLSGAAMHMVESGAGDDLIRIRRGDGEVPKLIRQALVFAGQADPWQTREVVRDADRSVEHVRLLHAGIEEADVDSDGLTAADIVRLLSHSTGQDSVDA